MSEASRLEQLWAGDFGDAYVERNRDAGAPRGPFWNSILDGLELQRVLEIGCNVGANLQWIAQRVPPSGVYGVDVNATAVAEVRRRLPGVNALLVPARDLPFRDDWFVTGKYGNFTGSSRQNDLIYVVVDFGAG